MAKKRYKNISNSSQNLIGIGVCEPGETIETNEEIVNGNFELVESKSKKSNSRKVKK